MHAGPSLDRAAALAELSTRLAAALTERDVTAVVAHCIRALGARRAVVAVLDEPAESLELVQHVDLPDEAAARLRRLPLTASFPIAHAVRTGEPVFVETADELARRFPDAAALLVPLGVRATASVPGTVGDAVRGAIGLGFDRPTAFDAAERQFVAAVAAQCAQAVERVRLRRIEREASERMRRLQRVTAALSHALSPRQVADVILHEGLDALGAAAGAVMRVSDDAAAFEYLGTVGYPPGTLERIGRIPVDAPLPVGDVWRAGAPVFVESIDEWERRWGVPPVRTGAGAWAALPLLADGRLFGAITLGFAAARRFAAEERGFMLSLAQQCAQALERARLYDEAVTANRAKASFLATMSHELRTPLTAVLGYMELVVDEVLGPVNAAQREHLLRARASGEHLLLLIEDLLAFARLEAGREVVRPEEVELQALVDDALTLVSPLATRKALPLHVDAAAAGALRTDRQKARQILVNLLANAVKFTEAGEVRLTTRDAGDDVLLAVRDTGPGIPAEHLEQVFDPFWQVDQARTRRAGGTGLGLSVARQLAQLLGGDVTAESRAGEGSTFTVRLPRRDESVGGQASGDGHQA